MLPSPPISIVDLKAHSALVRREDSRGESPVPDTVVNEPAHARTGWLYLDADESSALGRKHRDSLTDVTLEKSLYPDQREALAALDDAIRTGRMSYVEMEPKNPGEIASSLQLRSSFRSRLRQVAGHVPQHGANPKLMQSLARRLKLLPPPSGT
jgi:hypothetical protein